MEEQLESKNIKGRIKWIDVAKGICIIAIILGHQGETDINKVVFAFHLTVFFILSGYTLKKTKITKEYLNKKFVSLMKPYFITCFFVFLGDIINQIFYYKNASISAITNVAFKDLLRTFFASGSIKTFGSIELGTRIGAIWFLPALFFGIIFVQFILDKDYKRYINYFISIILALIGVITSKFIWLPFSIQSGMLAVPFILMGYECKQYNIIEQLNLKGACICFIIFLIGYFSGYTGFYYVSASLTDYFITSVISIATSFLVIYISKCLENCRLLNFLGRNSLYILCIHLFEMESGWPSKILERLNFTGEWYVRWIVKMIFILSVLFIILYLKNIYEKYKTNEEKNIISNNYRDQSIDLLRVGLIVLMLVGHNSNIDSNFRLFIYSFHMLMFVLLSGYFYKEKAIINIKNSILKLVKNFLAPYSLFAIIYLINNIMTNGGAQTTY